MPSPLPPRPLRDASRLAVGLFLLASTLATPAVAAPAGRLESPSLSPQGASITYQEWLAHEHDVIAFEPGPRVMVGFRPRIGDVAVVDGGAARALPAGRLSGRELLSASAAPAVDSPVVDPSAVVPATAASATVSPAPSAPVEAATASTLRRQTFGFLPYWEVGTSSLVLRYDLLSTIAYFAVGADGSGNLQKSNPDGTATVGWAGWTSAAMTSVITNAHANGTRVVLTVESFAWTTSQATTQAALLGSATARQNLAQQIVQAVRDRGADGVNLDFEPIASGYAASFTALVRTIRSLLSQQSAGYELTFDATGSIGNYPITDATASGAADAVVIMGYDYRTAGAAHAGSIAPLNGPAYDITDTVAAYLALTPASKVILAVPYYGRAWSTGSTGLDAAVTGSCSSVAVDYDQAAALLSQNGRRWDPIEQVAWTWYTLSGCTGYRELYVDDAQALDAKYDLINFRGLRGVGMWSLGKDGTRPELYQAIIDKFVNDTTPPEVGIVALPESFPDEGITVRWTGWDLSGISTYDVQVSVDGGAWTLWRTGTASTSGVYLSADGHTVAFRARAVDTKGNVSAWDVTTNGGTPASLAVGGFARVAAGGLSIRSAPTTAGTLLGTLASGAALDLIGGPVSADGYTWYQFTGPVTEWASVASVQTGVWAAAGGNGNTFLVPRAPINATTVHAGLQGLGFGGPAPSGVGPSQVLARTFSPNGDGRGDTLRLAWANAVTLSSLVLKIFQPSGALVGTIDLGAHAAGGAQSIDWDGLVGGSPVPDGTYSLQLVGATATATYTAPAALPTDPSVLSSYAVVVDRASQLLYAPLTPARLVDSRIGLGLAGPLPVRTVRTIAVAGHGGVPAGAAAVTLNLTVTGQTAGGYLSLGPSLGVPPATSTLNFPAGDTRANGATVPLAPDGTLAIEYVAAAGARTQVVIDVTGYTR